MNRFLKWSIALFAIIFAGLFVVLLVGGSVLYNTLPNDNAEVQISGLSSSTNVVFDKHGVPHIEADTYTDAVKVLGYIHARDRLWQMEFLRRVGEGRLSEILGMPTLETDKFLRTLNMAHASRKSFEKLMPKTREALEAYAQGVNAYINRPTKMFETSLGTEFVILGHQPEAWEPWNSVLLLKVMGLTLSKNMDDEIRRLAMASKGFSEREIDEILVYGTRDNPPPLPDLKRLYGFSPKGKNARVDTNLDVASSTQRQELKFDWPTGRSASNAWVVAGSKTKSGKPILSNDPHLGLSSPSVFYLAHSSWKDNGEQRHIIGGSFPGIPFFITGRNSKLAWGLTNTGLDNQDLFIEQINLQNSNQYRTPDGWADFESEEVEIKISDAEPYVLNRRISRNGPILPEEFRSLNKYLPDNTVAALKWLGLAEDDTTLDTLYLSGLAGTVDEFFQAANRAVTPMQTSVVADIDGNIGFATPGRLPVRKPENLVMGRAPVPGWLDEYQWQTPLESAQLPRFKNPESGAFAVANAKNVPAEYKQLITFDWAEEFRQKRAEALVIADKKKHDVASARQVMADDLSVAMLNLVKISKRQAKTGAGKAGVVLDALSKWDGRMQMDKPEPLIALAFYKNLHENILKDDFGDAYDLIAKGKVSRILGILERGTLRNWCDDQSTSVAESCSDMIIKSLNEALTELEALQGPEWQNWKYGDTHKAFAEHRPFSNVGALAKYFEIEVSSSGGPYTLHRAQPNFSKEKPFRTLQAAAYRAIYNFDDLDESLYIQSSGQSGNFLSDHYDDFAKLWAQSEYIKMSTNKAYYQEESIGTWVFTP